jgi:hypothetical protein
MALVAATDGDKKGVAVLKLLGDNPVKVLRHFVFVREVRNVAMVPAVEDVSGTCCMRCLDHDYYVFHGLGLSYLTKAAMLSVRATDDALLWSGMIA